MSRFEGACLCGDVQYRMEGEVLGFYHCHCERCRKTTGTGHASNIRVASDGPTWLKGADLIRTYSVPEAIRFRNDFCGNCGSPMPRHIPEAGFVILPAGTLNTALPKGNFSRIFCASRAEWSCRDGLPEYDEYAPQ